MINDLFIDARTDVINFNRFVVLMISVHDHLDLNLLTSFFSFETFSTTDEKFKIKMFRRFSCWHWNVYNWNIVTQAFCWRTRTRWTSSTLKWNCFVNYLQLINFLLQFFVDLSNLFELIFWTRQLFFKQSQLMMIIAKSNFVKVFISNQVLDRFCLFFQNFKTLIVEANCFILILSTLIKNE